MKKFVLTTLVMCSVSLFAFANESLQVVNVSSLVEGGIQETLKGNCPFVAIEFSEKTVLPLSLFLQGDLFKFVQASSNSGELEVQKTFYLRVVEGDLLFSTNLEEWKSFSEFGTGNLSVKLDVHEGKAFIECGAELNQRD